MDILDFLRADGSIVVNKQLAHRIGLQEAVVYSELVSLYKYWSSKGELTKDGFFYCTYENLERNTSLKEKVTLRAINKLIKMELVEKVTRGLPRKNYYKITKGIYKLMDEKDEPEPDPEKEENPVQYRQNGGTDNDSALQGPEEEKGGSNPRGIQYRQNGGTSTAKQEVLVPRKRRSNNTRTNNTRINNTDKRSISENDIDNMLIATPIKKQLQINQKRLIDEGITLETIHKEIQKYKGQLSDAELSFIIGSILQSTKGPIQNFSRLFYKAVHNHILERGEEKKNKVSYEFGKRKPG